MSISIEKLKLRVQTGISNPAEFLEQEELFIFAVDETTGIVGTKDLADAFVMDIAYYRFLLLADVGASKQNESDYKMALFMLKNASNLIEDIETGATTTTAPILVGQRKSEY